MTPRQPRRPWTRWLVYTAIGVALIASTLLTQDTTVARWVTARWDGASTDSGTEAATDVASEVTVSTRQDIETCVRITQIAQRHQAGELTDQGYASAFAQAIDGAGPDGDVARYAAASLEAFEAGDAAVADRARTGLANACAAAAG